METIVLHILFWLINHGPLDRTQRINEAIDRAEEALNRKEYAVAGREFGRLVDSLRVTEPEARLDRAHALYNQGDTVNAQKQYDRLDSIADSKLSSVALQQLGVLEEKGSKREQAIAYFKQALRRDPANEEARFNYELLVKREKQQKEEEKKQNSEDQKASDYAKRLKAQAEALAKERKYGEAHALMQEGLKKDKTVSVYKEFIKRLGIVSKIAR